MTLSQTVCDRCPIAHQTRLMTPKTGGARIVKQSDFCRQLVMDGKHIECPYELEHLLATQHKGENK